MLPFHISPWNTLLRICSTFLAPADKPPPVLTHPPLLSPPPLPLPLGKMWHSFVIVFKSGQMQTSRICAQSPLGHPCLISCNVPPSGGPRWPRQVEEKRKGKLCRSHTVTCKADVCVCTSCRSEVMGMVITYALGTWDGSLMEEW